MRNVVTVMFAAIGFAIWLWPGAPTSHADEVHLPQERQTYADVTVTGLRGGMLEFRSRAHGNTLRKPFSKTGPIRLDDQPEFNRAEALFSQARYAECIRPYELFRRQARSGWLPDAIDLRLLAAYDQAGRFDKAVATFLQLLRRIPDEAMAQRPRRVPRRGSQYNRIALDRIEPALKRFKASKIVRELKLVKLEILYAEQDPSVDRLAAELGAQELRYTKLQKPDDAAKARKIEQLIERGRYDQALALIRADAAVESAERLDGLLLLMARCQLATARTSDQMTDAALTAMRVAIHFEHGEHVPEALFIAALVHERLGLADKAIELYQQCRDHPATAGTVAGRAAQAVKRLAADPERQVDHQR